MAIGETILRFSNPAFYQQQLAAMGTFYKPMVRAGSVTPMWHLFLFTSVTMYTTKYIAFGHRAVDVSRKEKATAMEEYYEKHGHSGHH
uniref:Uncharacterized protein n=1 Tax=Leptocylindrus danicus TaxID=163516 RepID=A0A7S2PP04_9STRA|eukprot:CAMPEP_0116029438 /NCGR_PEP_ID=MMETSP0321-20121206/16141_1 /TAXON_ID=163516 /ORGANISM="Leptocylindrus danicus var. danicus, Strain B650" /LENGTH=87 /DNA_ID=CAMNT_0003503817 /DNA_START=18 /DNA_END=281 /DNA_ORIENTATION=+